MEKHLWSQIIHTEIEKLRKIQVVLSSKNPSHPNLIPTIENAIYSLSNLVVYIDGGNPYFPDFDEYYFYNRQGAMHLQFFTNLHTSIDDGLHKIIKDKGFTIEINSQKRVKRIVDSIESKLAETSIIKDELNKISELANKKPFIKDALDTVFDNVKDLDENFIKGFRVYLEGLGICRNKAVHRLEPFTDDEKQRLIKAKLGKVISTDGSMQMTFEGYSYLVNDIIKFFDTIYANL